MPDSPGTASRTRAKPAPGRKAPPPPTPGRHRNTEEFQAFYQSLYLGLGRNRSLEALAAAIKGTPIAVVKKTLARYSSLYHWVEHAQEFDRERAERAGQAVIQQVIQDDVTTAQMGRAMQSMATLAIREFMSRQPKDQKLPGGDIARLGEIGVKLERLASGRATEVVEVMFTLRGALVDGFSSMWERQYEAAEAALRRRGIPEDVILEMREASLHAYAPAADQLLDQQFRQMGIVDSSFVGEAAE